jgi:hypothetical protein
MIFKYFNVKHTLKKLVYLGEVDRLKVAPNTSYKIIYSCLPRIEKRTLLLRLCTYTNSGTYNGSTKRHAFVVSSPPTDRSPAVALTPHERSDAHAGGTSAANATDLPGVQPSSRRCSDL